ncbi:retrovirus-related pol polyprotein from transposon TNT 1-94 [Tanacetum coccineum]
MSSQPSSSVSVVEKFNGKSNFSLWRVKVRALLKQQGIWAPLAGPKPADIIDAKFNSLDEKAHSTILLSLSDEVLYEVADEETAAGVWKKLEKLYMTKSLTNKLLLKQRLFITSLVWRTLCIPVLFGKVTITLEDVRSSLHSSELRHQASGTSQSQPVGLSITIVRIEAGIEHKEAKEKEDIKIDRSRGFSRVKIIKNTCYYCHKEGLGGSTGRKRTNVPKLKEKGQGSDRFLLKNGIGGSGTRVPTRDWFVTYEEFDGGHVFMGNDSPCKVIGIGTIQIRMHDGVVRTLTDVRHVPDLKKNLISLGVFDSKGFKYTSENGVLRVSKGALVVMKATKGTSSLYTLQGETITSSASVSCTEKSNSDLTKLWHMRLGHIVLMTWVFMMKHKSEAFEKFKHWKILIENQTGRKIKRLRTDNGLEFCSREFEAFCRDEGIVSALHLTLLERTRCLLLNAGLDRSFWAEALNTTCYLVNRSPATAIDCKTPIEVWTGKPADYSKLRVFGCPAYYHVSDGKLNPRANKGIFMGYGDGVKGYRIWSPSERRVILSRDVTFDEDHLFRLKPDSVESKFEEGASEKVEHVAKQVEYVEHEVPEDTDHDVTSLDPPNSAHLEHEQYRSIALDRPRRDAKAPSRLGFQNYVAYALQVAEEVESLEPATYQEAITSKDSDMWSAGSWAPSGSLIYLLLYVDDMLVAAKDMEEIKKLKILLNTEFDMKDLGAARKILGMEIIRDRKHGKLFLSQKSYIEKIISRFGMSSAKSNTYASAVGSLMYVMVCTRPDIAHAMSVVSRYMAHPGKEHWNAVKRIFRYLKGTSDVGLIYGGEREYLVAGYSDSDYAADLDARRSLTGYVFTIGKAAKEGIWLKGLIEDLGFPQDQAIVFCDSMSAMVWLKTSLLIGLSKKLMSVITSFVPKVRIQSEEDWSPKTNPADVFY